MATSGNKGGDQITIGNMTNVKAAAIGRHAQASNVEGVSGSDLQTMFATIYSQIEARPDDPNVDKSEIQRTVKDVEQEVALGEQANPSKVRRWLTSLADAAPDIFEITAAALTSPVAGVAAAIRAVANRIGGQTADAADSGQS